MISFSSSSSKVIQSAVEPANPAMTFGVNFQTFFAVFLKTVFPSEI